MPDDLWLNERIWLNPMLLYYRTVFPKEQLEYLVCMRGDCDKEFIAGILMLRNIGSCSEIVCIFVLPEYRRNGIAKRLLHAVSVNRSNSDKDGFRNAGSIRIRVTDRCGGNLIKSLKNEKFLLVSEQLNYIVNNNSVTYQGWQTLKTQLQPFKEKLCQKDFQLCSFVNADKSFVNAVLQLSEECFPQHSAKLLIGRNDFMPAASFFVHKKGKLAAYSLISSPDGVNSVQEQLAAADEYRNSGAFLLPLLASVDFLFHSDIKKCVYAVWDDNTVMKHFTESKLELLQPEKLRQYCYEKSGL